MLILLVIQMCANFIACARTIILVLAVIVIADNYFVAETVGLAMLGGLCHHFLWYLTADGFNLG